MQTSLPKVNDEGVYGGDYEAVIPGKAPFAICTGPATIRSVRGGLIDDGLMTLDFYFSTAGGDQPPTVTSGFSTKFVAYPYNEVGFQVPAGATSRVRASYVGAPRTAFVTVLMGD